MPSSHTGSGAVCGVCASPVPDVYYSSMGTVLCRVCYYAEQTGAQNTRAAQSLAANAPPGFVPKRSEETRASRVRTGWIALAMCVASTVLTALLLSRIYLWSAVIGIFALGSFARALKLPRLHGHRGNIGIGVGIAATLIVLFAILAVTILGV